jgi:uncharacterized membrane protein YeaQ/YmgE (transglycosylase-associated protein family)
MDQSVTLSFVPQQLLTWLVVGLIAGWLASLLMRGQSLGLGGNMLLGLLGALLGGFCFTVLGIQVPAALSGGILLNWSDILVALSGALVLLLLFGGFYRRRRPLT